jgi:hypothetical protein
VHELLALECPEFSDKTITAEDQLALSLMRSLLPDLPEVEAHEIMRHRVDMEAEPSLKESFDEAVHPGVLLDVASRDDHKAASEFKADHEKAKQQYHKRNVSLGGFVVKAYGIKNTSESCEACDHGRPQAKHEHSRGSVV